MNILKTCKQSTSSVTRRKFIHSVSPNSIIIQMTLQTQTYITSEIDALPIFDFRNWTLPDEIRRFLQTRKRTFVPIRDLCICYLMIFSSWLASLALPVWWVYTITCLTVTSALVGFIALAHESFHDNLASKKINDFLAAIFIAPPLLMDYEAERQIHLNHHKYLGTKEDPTLSEYTCTVKELWRRLILRIILVGSFIWVIKKRLNSQFWIKTKFSPKRFFLNLFMIFEQVCIFYLFFTINIWAYLWNWILPLILTSIFSSIREFGEHKSFDNKNLICIATTRTNLIERLLISGFNFTHHAAHHLFPSVPYDYLPAFTELLDKYTWPKSQIPLVDRYSYIANLTRVTQ